MFTGVSDWAVIFCLLALAYAGDLFGFCAVAKATPTTIVQLVCLKLGACRIFHTEGGNGLVFVERQAFNTQFVGFVAVLLAAVEPQGDLIAGVQ